MILGDRSLYELTFDDFKSLIDNRVPEGPRLEYKRSVYTRNAEKKLEMLRDITALANADGGYLILGIAEDEGGRAANLFPIENLSSETQAINQSCLDGIQERIEGLEINSFESEQNKGIIVIHVPHSKQRPHMISKDNRTDFFRRYGTDKRTMTVSEIKDNILSNPWYRRSVELEVLANLQNSNEGSKTNTVKPLSYIQLFTQGSVEQFIKRYLISSVQAKILIIISPFIGDLEGELFNLQGILNKATKDRTRVYVITKPPTEKYQIKSMEKFLACPIVELRYNSDIHAKLFVCWGRKPEESFALFGSGNLTTGGLRHNLELGMMILSKGHGETLVTDLYEWGGFSVRTTSQIVKQINI